MQGENGAVQGAAGPVHYKVDSRQNRNGRKRRGAGPGREDPGSVTGRAAMLRPCSRRGRHGGHG